MEETRKITAGALSDEEKIALVSGTDFMYTNPIPRLRIRALSMADGPHGVRKQTGKLDNGFSMSEPATAFPTASCTASGWNPENLYRMGEAMAEECLAYGVDILLGPGANIKRNPLCGRNFEYFSEDPLLSGKLAAAEIRGVQSRGVGTSLKHFALNNSENFRYMGNSVCDARSMREIYLKSFEIAVKEGKPDTVMCAYNRLGGTYCAENKWLLSDLLRDEWGFDGVVMTDWGAMHDRKNAILAGLDLEMPGDTPICRRRLFDALENNEMQNALNASADRILRLYEKYADHKKQDADFDAHHVLAAEIAADCAVLLKNDGVLPLRTDEKICILGEMFSRMRYQGSGSSMICATRITTPQNAFDERGAAYTYAQGYRVSGECDPALIDTALVAARGCEKILIFAGLTESAESEGVDREGMSLPENQLALIRAVLPLGKPVVVVLFGGAVMELPFADEVDGILNMFLPGQNGGNAVADLLFGIKTPCGKLAETWMREYRDVPFGDVFGKKVHEVYYENIFVGYRYYLEQRARVRYPFGYGLSYTAFSYDDMTLKTEGDTVTVTADITNIGAYSGAEIVELYVAAPKTQVYKPMHELRAFTKVCLAPDETKKVTLSFSVNDLRYYDIKENRRVLEEGVYDVRLCSDAQTVKLSMPLPLSGERDRKPYGEGVLRGVTPETLETMGKDLFSQMSGMAVPTEEARTPITLESCFGDIRYTFWGRMVYRCVLLWVNRQMRQARRMPDGAARDNKMKGAIFFRRVIDNNSILAMSMCAKNVFPYNYAQALVHFVNGKPFRAVGCFFRRLKVPKLPKQKYKPDRT